MPTAKEKGGSPSHRYRPASEYDDATLTQKRQYWRTKKREQRARLTERRGKGAPGGKLLHLRGPAVGGATLSDPFAAFAPPLQSNDDSCKTLAVSGSTDFGASSVKAGDNQKEKWLHTMKLDRVSPQLPASCSISASARGPVSRAATSPTPSGPPLHPRSSVPPVRATGTTNGSAAEPTPQPRVSMQGASVPNAHHEAQVALRILPTHMTGMLLLSPPCGSVKTEGGPQSGTTRALVTLQRPTGGSNARSLPEPEEERAARRREQWRIKKREQRAKVAAQIARARERTQSAAEETPLRRTAQHAGLDGGKPLQHLPPQAFLRGAGQRPCPTRARTAFTSARRGHADLQSVAGRFAPVNLPADRIMGPNPHGYRTAPPALACNAVSVGKPGESMRKFPGYGLLSNVARGIARCRTPRQRFIDAQKSFMNQRNLRCRSPFLSSVFHTRNMPQIDPNDTPEQIIAKRREYWRIKKREQRAKLSLEVKSRLKERDSLMRRMKRYQSILEQMRRARALAQSAGSGLAHEAIGGFIKEDGTLSVSIPQAPSLHRADGQLLVDDTLTTRPQHHGVTSPVRVAPPPLLRPARVKVSFPLAGLVNMPPGLTRPAPHMLAIQTVSQITLTHPLTPHGAASGVWRAAPNPGGCVMKMEVSSNLSTLSLDPNLTEEERMAKKREYWRIKKREQRAARASRLKQGALQARASATLQRRRAQKLGAMTSAPLGRSLPDHTGDAPSLPNDTPATPHANEIKQESESLPDVELHAPPEHAVCPDIKAPSSPPPAEPDPALNAECQATTLLAVASMKKLLEESLSTVAEPTAIKMESTEEAWEQEVEPLSPHSESAPIAADLTLEIKSWPLESDASLRASSPSPHGEDSFQRSEALPPLPSPSEALPPLPSPSEALPPLPSPSEALPPLPSPSEVVLPPTCEHSSQTLSNFIVNSCPEAASPRRAQRLRAKQPGLQSCGSLEPPRLHHAPLDRPQPRQQPREQREECHNSTARPAQGHLGVGAERGGSFSLQRKREYWKLMKRQQRARLRARQKDRQGECSGRLAQRNMQAPSLVNMNIVRALSPPGKPSLQPRPLTAVTGLPSAVGVGPSTRSARQPPDALRVKPPVSGGSCSARSEQNHVNVGTSQIMSDGRGAHEDPQQAAPASRQWMSKSPELDSAPSLPTLRPPDNPLSSINLRPIEAPHTPHSSPSPIRIPCSRLTSPAHVTHSPTKLASITAMVPPKPIPGEAEEDFLRRKREYWRVKKKEQRARKAIRDKGVTSRRAPTNLRPILPAQDTQTQDGGQWVSSSEESEHLMSNSEDTDPGAFSFSSYTAPVEVDSELLFGDYENGTGEEDPVSDAVWRSRYLMDYDPLNQLLVCMVCGELQYSHNLEGVTAHIDEAHPESLALEPREQQQILEAWDEQVSQRERFFTSQLQQHSGGPWQKPTGTEEDCTSPPSRRTRV